MKHLLSLLTVLFPTLLYAGGGTLVGNGGEGILQDGRLYVRDLIEYGVHESPWVGSEVNADLRREIHSWRDLRLNYAQKEILARKLTDANRLFPRFGTYIADAIQFFSWRFLDVRLGLFPEQFTLIPYPVDKRRQIASRYLHSIVVDNKEFDRLDDVHKVALFVHEAVYAMARVVLTHDSSKPLQDLGATKAIVAGLFTSPEYRNDVALRTVIKASLMIPAWARYETHKASSVLKLAFRLSGFFMKPILEKESASGFDRNFRRSLISSFCESVEVDSIHSDTEERRVIEIDLGQSPIQLRPEYYSGAAGMQIILRFVGFEPSWRYKAIHIQRDGRGRMSFLSNGERFDCKEHLALLLDSVYSY